MRLEDILRYPVGSRFSAQGAACLRVPAFLDGSLTTGLWYC